MKYNWDRSKLMEITEQGLVKKLGTMKRLNNCKAFYYNFSYNGRDYVGLMSYSTIVAVYSVSTETVYKFDYYSATTCQHIAKFATFMHVCYRSDVTIVPLYDHSRMPRQAARDAIACDFADQIFEYSPTIDAFNMLMLTLRDGGGTFNFNGEPASIESGYIVGGFSKCYKISCKGVNTSLCEYRFIDHVNDLIEELPVNLEGLFIGTWVDNGIVYLELSRHFGTLAVAIQAGKIREQDAIYDVVNDVSIRL